MKIIMENGLFVAMNANEGETFEPTRKLSGKIVGMRERRIDEEGVFIQIDLKDETGAEPVTRTFEFQKYSDAGLKLLRLLYGIADNFGGKVIVIETTPREGTRKSRITMTADGEVLEPMGETSAYGYDKKLLTDKIWKTLQSNLRFRKDVLTYYNEDKYYPQSAREVADYILGLRRTGSSLKLSVKKNGFTNVTAANAYFKALADVRNGSFRVYTNPDDIAVIWEAYTCEVQVEEVPAEDQHFEESQGLSTEEY